MATFFIEDLISLRKENIMRIILYCKYKALYGFTMFVPLRKSLFCTLCIAKVCVKLCVKNEKPLYKCL